MADLESPYNAAYEFVNAAHNASQAEAHLDVEKLLEQRDAAIREQERAARDAEWRAAYNGTASPELGPKSPAELRVFLEESAHVDREQAEQERAGYERRIAELETRVDEQRALIRKLGEEYAASRVGIMVKFGELHEHLALMVRYLEEETSQGDGIAEEHWDGFQGAKSALARTAPDQPQWENAQLEIHDLLERASRVPGLTAELERARRVVEAVNAILEKGPRYTDRHLEAAADAVVDEIREAMAFASAAPAADVEQAKRGGGA